MSGEATIGDVALQVAHLSGKVDAYQQSVRTELTSVQRELERAAREHERLERTVDSLLSWRAWITGIGAGVGLVVTLLSVFSLAHTAGVHF
jgi:ElaB/YqjD/DUF883 family membrane-anchored ribosome-binding protein